MIPIILLFIFLFALTRNYKKTFIVMFVLYTFLSQFKIPGIPFNLFQTLSFFSVIIFTLKYGIRNLYIKDMPIAFSLFAICISYFISNYYGQYKHYPTLIANIIIVFNLIIFYSILKPNPQQYIVFFIKVCYFYGAVISIYALFESITRTNPYIQFVNSADIYSLKFYCTEIRFGLKRCQSIFSMHTTLAAVSLLLGCVLLYVKTKTRMMESYKYSSIVIVLLFLSVFLTGARSGMIGTIICLLGFIYMKRLKIKYIISFLFIGITCFFIFFDYLILIYNSIIDTNLVGGSNTEMREGQFAIAQYFMDQSFWFGNGISYTFEYVQSNFKDEILGAESLWFPIMIDYGAFGIIAYLMYVLSFCYYIIKQQCLKLLFILLGFLLFNSMSSMPNFNFLYLFAFINIMIEISQSPNLRCRVNSTTRLSTCNTSI